VTGARPALHVAVLAPQWLDLHADTGNAEILIARAGWEGVEVTVVDLDEGAPPAVDIWLAGDGDDATLPVAFDALRAQAPALEASVADGAAVLAVGLGWHLLATAHEITPGLWHAGLGVFAGEAPLLPRRASGELVTASPWGPMFGYENHARGHRPGAEENAWGRVASGVGNGDRTEGVHAGALVGTHLHGPVLAQNPALADWLLERALLRRHGIAYSARSAEAKRVDELSAESRRRAIRSREVR
jgi:hypothetical protein